MAINKDNIIYEYRYDKTVLKYKLNDFIIIGIPLKIIYDEYIDMNYITKLFISDKNTLELLNNIDNNSNKSLKPTSIIGMLWLQTHFEDNQWEALSNNQVIISKENSKLLVKDAISAGLKIKSSSGVSILDVFQKKN